MSKINFNKSREIEMQILVTYLHLGLYVLSKVNGHSSKDFNYYSKNIIEVDTEGSVSLDSSTKLSENCYWPHLRSFPEIVSYGISKRKDDIIETFLNRFRPAHHKFNYYKDFTVNSVLSGKKNASESYRCNSTSVCEIHIEWDGEGKFDSYLSITDLGPEHLGYGKFQRWQFKHNGNYVTVIHRFYGNIPRQIFFNRFDTLVKGKIDYGVTYDSGSGSGGTLFYDDLKHIVMEYFFGFKDVYAGIFCYI